MRGASFSLSLSNKCLTYDLGCARVKRMAGTLQPGRKRILRYLALRVVGQSVVGARRGDLSSPRGAIRDRNRRPTSESTVKRLYGENGEVRLGLESGENGEPLIPAVGARVQGRVAHGVVHPAEKKAARGRA
jgi:hypothetical protein